MFFDSTYLIYVFIPTILISGAVQLYLKSTFKTWNNVRNSAAATGADIGLRVFDRTSLEAIPLERSEGKLSDHFDPRANVVRLSDEVAKGSSVAAMAIVAHELGHVQQQQSHSPLMAARGFLVPALTVSPMISYGAIMAGLLLSITGLIWIGVIAFSVMVVFSILTLPVEIDASRRALVLLDEAGMMQTEDDRMGSRKVLTAAALTYVAAAVTAVIQLVYYVALARD